jgi:hypothetical protein
LSLGIVALLGLFGSQALLPRLDWLTDYVRNAFFFGLIALGAWLYQLGRRLRQRTATELTSTDKRPPILILRSFPDDQSLKIPKSGFLVPSGVTGKSIAFEEILARKLSAYGPVIAIGRPGEAVPPLGAARQYVPAGANWRDEVRVLLDRCRWIVAMVGATEGLRWELETVLELGKPEKLLVVVPPLPSKLLDPRLSSFRSIFRERIGKDLPSLDPKTVLLSFTADWESRAAVDPDLVRNTIWPARSGHYDAFLDTTLARIMSPDGTDVPGRPSVRKVGPKGQASITVVWSLIASLFLVAAYSMMVVYHRLRLDPPHQPREFDVTKRQHGLEAGPPVPPKTAEQ